MSGETFGDGGLVCPYCKEYVEEHTLSEERDSRGRRKWMCPPSQQEIEDAALDLDMSRREAERVLRRGYRKVSR